MKKKIIKWTSLILWLLVIFLFSNQAHSGQVTHNLIDQILPGVKTSGLTEIINFIIRKSAHITEYFILTLLSISLLKEYTKKERKILIASIIFCFLYACTDEFHQSFVSGRTSTFKDVLIDTSGGIIALILYTFYHKTNLKKNTIE